MKPLIILIILVFSQALEAQTPIISQRINENIEMRISASEFSAQTVFHMKNINGDLNVEGYEGNEIIITGTKIVIGKPAALGDLDPDEFFLDRLREGNHLFVFIRQPGLEVHIDGDELHYRTERKKNKYGADDRPDFEFNLQLQIPHNLMAEISTINAGEVVVEGMNNGIEATNVNGSVYVSEVKGPVKAHTVNGDIRVEYNDSPSSDAYLNTVNGTIELIAPENLSAVVTFKSLHGELYTDFNQVSYLNNRTTKKKDGMSRFSIESSTKVQIGEGGPELHFQLLNGNGYIKKRTS